MLLRTTIGRNQIIPILKITKTCIANPSLTNSIKQSALLSEITRTIEKAEYPNLEKSEEIGVLVNIIFKSEGELERFMEVVTLK